MIVLFIRSQPPAFDFLPEINGTPPSKEENSKNTGLK